MRTAKVISISLPPDMNSDVQELAREERRSVSEVMRQALRQYMLGRTIEQVRHQAKKTAKKKKIRPEDVERIVDEGRE